MAHPGYPSSEFDLSIDESALANLYADIKDPSADRGHYEVTVASHDPRLVLDEIVRNMNLTMNAELREQNQAVLRSFIRMLIRENMEGLDQEPEPEDGPVRAYAEVAKLPPKMLEDNETCPVCTEPMKDMTKLCYCTLKCQHSVHIACYDHWIKVQRQPTCVMCREPASMIEFERGLKETVLSNL